MPARTRQSFVAVLLGVGLLAAACTSSAPPPGAVSTTSTTTSITTSTTDDVPATSRTASTVTETTVASSSTVPQMPLDDLALALVQVGAGFDAPVLLVADPDGGTDLVVEQSGRIVRSDGDHSVVLDIRADVLFDGEQGLLGLAFHPRFDDNGLAYVNYVDRSGTTIIEEFVVSSGIFDVGTRHTILTVKQPAPNHNGGMIAFGPSGHLWIGMGDGGGSNDRFANAQDPATLHGAMLRISVGGPEDDPYSIPEDNPFVDGVGGAPEVWATGLRNPWRFSFDGQDVWIADVGQNDVEEVNAVSAALPALNFGWPVMEGSMCFAASTCDRTLLVEPVAEYPHGEGCSITGGHVYRGDATPQLHGHYFYSDYCSGFLRSYTDTGEAFDWTDTVGETAEVSGFGLGSDGELYVVSHRGTIYRLEAHG